DVGSGGGFPGIPLAIALPWLEVVLVEATAKKASFLHHARERLNLPNLRVLQGRAEDLAREASNRETFDLATARAVGRVATLAELLAPFLAIGGAAILMKTHAQLVDELPSAAPALAALGLESGRVVDVEITGLSGRALVVLDKTGPTPAEYPRRAGVPGR